MSSITAIIPTYNEEKCIRKSLESVLWADEVIVVDSFSTDGTERIVKEYPQVTFIQHEYINSTTQKNWIIPQAKNDWVFILDADEWIDELAIEEIKKSAAEPGEYVAFKSGRINYFMDQPVPHVWKGDSVVRLIHKDFCRYEELAVHGEIKAKGKVKTLRHPIQHDTYAGKGYDKYVVKMLRYSSWSALDKLPKTHKVTAFHFVVKPFYSFIKHYIIKGGFRDGKPGFIIACLTSWNVFQRYVKIYRMKQGEEFEDIKP